MEASAFARRQLDRRFSELRTHLHALHTPRGGWIRLLRTVLGMRQEDLAVRLRVSPQAVGRLERREAEDGATLGALREAADALNADLYYVLLPRVPLESQIEARVESVARDMASRIHHSMRMEDQETESPELHERIQEIKEQLRRTPQLLWTLPDDG